LDDVEDLYEYWKDHPPMHEILAAVHKVKFALPGSNSQQPASPEVRATAGELMAMGVNPMKQELPLLKYSRWAVK